MYIEAWNPHTIGLYFGTLIDFFQDKASKKKLSFMNGVSEVNVVKWKVSKRTFKNFPSPYMAFMYKIYPS